MKDSGIGIKEENIGRLFELFSREEEGAQVDQSGLGLGLTICKTIVEQFGGKISVTSVFEEGSTFSFTFGFEEETSLDLSYLRIAEEVEKQESDRNNDKTVSLCDVSIE